MAVAHLTTHRFPTKPPRSSILTCALIGLLAGCSHGPSLSGASPRVLVPETSVQADRLASPPTSTLSLLLPLSGPSAGLGQQLWDAAVMALFDGARDDVILIPHDTQGTPEGAAAAAQAAVMSGAKAVVGPLYASSVAAAKPILASGDVHGVGLSNNRTVAGEPFFLMGNHPETQVDAIAAYLDSTGRKRVALFGPDTPYLRLIRDHLAALDRDKKLRLVDARLYAVSASYTEVAQEVRSLTLYDRRAAALREFAGIFADSWRDHDDPEEALKSALAQMSGRVERVRAQQASISEGVQAGRRNWSVTEAEYEAALTELMQHYREQLRSTESARKAMEAAVGTILQRETLGRADFDAVLLPIGDRPLLVIAPMFEYFNASQPDVWLIGTDIWETAARHLPRDLDGGRYVTATSSRWAAFAARFEAEFGSAPDRLAATVYDAVRIAIAEKQESGDLSFKPHYLTRQAGFEGVNGAFRFLPGGTNERTLNVMELRRKGAMHVFTWLPDRTPEGGQPPALARPRPVEEKRQTVPPIS